MHLVQFGNPSTAGALRHATRTRCCQQLPSRHLHFLHFLMLFPVQDLGFTSGHFLQSQETTESQSCRKYGPVSAASRWFLRLLSRGRNCLQQAQALPLHATKSPTARHAFRRCLRWLLLLGLLSHGVCPRRRNSLTAADLPARTPEVVPQGTATTSNLGAQFYRSGSLWCFSFQAFKDNVGLPRLRLDPFPRSLKSCRCCSRKTVVGTWS